MDLWHYLPYREDRERQKIFLYGSAAGGVMSAGILATLFALGAAFFYPRMEAAMQREASPGVTRPYGLSGGLAAGGNFFPRGTQAAPADAVAAAGGVTAKPIRATSAPRAAGITPGAIPLPTIPVPSVPAAQSAPQAQPVPVQSAAASGQSIAAVPENAPAKTAEKAMQDGRIAFFGGDPVPLGKPN